jgi:ArsR family transcriptional regulator
VATPRIVTEPRNLTVEMFRALADPIRLELLAQIAARGPLCVCHLQEDLPYSQSRISKHLGTLRRAGLVTTRREGTWVYYSVDEAAIATARDFIDQLERSMCTPHEADYCPPPE